MQRRVVITGLGIVAPNSIGIDEFYKTNLNGISTPSLIENFDTTKHDIKFAAQIKGFNPDDFMTKIIENKTDRFAQFGIAATKMAIENSHLEIKNELLNRVGVYIGTGLGGVKFHEEEMLSMIERNKMKSNPFTVPKVSCNAAASWISIIYGFSGPNMTVSTACSSSANAIGIAFDAIRYDRVDLAVSGGTEAPITPYSFGAFSSIGVMSKKNTSPNTACCPFDKNRDGFVMGEGAGIIILEELEKAKKRNARIYAEIVGYGASNGNYHMVIPQANGKDVAQAMQSALKDAAISPSNIDYINAHGTSTQANDRIETMAIKEVFSQHAHKIPISSTKSMIGHLIGAAGAVEIIASTLSLNNNVAFPTINYNNPDPECDLDYVPNFARECKINTVLSNSFGFGGNNASIILKRYN